MPPGSGTESELRASIAEFEHRFRELSGRALHSEYHSALQAIAGLDQIQYS